MEFLHPFRVRTHLTFYVIICHVNGNFAVCNANNATHTHTHQDDLSFAMSDEMCISEIFRELRVVYVCLSISS